MVKFKKNFLLGLSTIIYATSCYAATVQICATKAEDCEPAPLCAKIADGSQLAEPRYQTPVQFKFKNFVEIEGSVGPWKDENGNLYGAQEVKILSDPANMSLVVEKWDRDGDNTKFTPLIAYPLKDVNKYAVNDETGVVTITTKLPDRVYTSTPVSDSVYRVYAKSKLRDKEVRTQPTDFFYVEDLLHGLIEVYPTQNSNEKEPFIIKSKWFYGNRELDRCQVQNVKWFVDGIEKENKHFDAWLYKHNAEPYVIEANNSANVMLGNTNSKTIKFVTTAEIFADDSGALLTTLPNDTWKLRKVTGRLAITAVITQQNGSSTIPPTDDKRNQTGQNQTQDTSDKSDGGSSGGCFAQPWSLGGIGLLSALFLWKKK